MHTYSTYTCKKIYKLAAMYMYVLKFNIQS